MSSFWKPRVVLFSSTFFRFLFTSKNTFLNWTIFIDFLIILYIKLVKNWNIDPGKVPPCDNHVRSFMYSLSNIFMLIYIDILLYTLLFLYKWNNSMQNWFYELLFIYITIYHRYLCMNYILIHFYVLLTLYWALFKYFM